MGRQLKRELIQCMPIKYSSAIDWNYHPRGTSISQPQHRWVWYLWCWSEFPPGLGYMSHAKTERTEFLVPSGSPHLFFFCVPQERDTFLVIYLPCLGKTRQKERKKKPCLGVSSSPTFSRSRMPLMSSIADLSKKQTNPPSSRSMVSDRDRLVTSSHISCYSQNLQLFGRHIRNSRD